MLIIMPVCLYACARENCSDFVLKYEYAHGGCVCFAGAELDLGSEARKGRDAWRNLAMRLINSLATQSRFIK